MFRPWLLIVLIATDSATSCSRAAAPGIAAPRTAYCGIPEKLRQPRWPRNLRDTSPGEQQPPIFGTITIVLLPDTQYYTWCEYPHLRNQSTWIWAERTARNIVAAIALGDLTDRNRTQEWEFLSESYGPLLQGFPLFLTTGNHDLGFNGRAADRSSKFSQYFTEEWARRTGGLREVMRSGAVDNAFYALDLGKVKLGVLMLEWSPRGQTVAWANQVLARYPDHRVIIATHAYLYHDNTRYDFDARGKLQEWNPMMYGTAHGEGAKDENHDGEMLWNNLVRRHANVFMVASGHVLADGSGLLTSRGDGGNTVHQVLANYQMLDEGGLGFLRLLEILPDGRTLRMKTYSPSLNLFSHADDQQFALSVDPPLF